MRALPGHGMQLAESPLRHDDELAYVDMLAGTVHRLDLRTLIESSVPVTQGALPYVGAVVAVSGGGLAAITVDAVVRVGDGPGIAHIVTILDRPGSRLNDAAVDPRGRLWVGSVALDLAPGGGALHMWSPGEGVRTVHDGMTLPNGIGWSPDGASVYVVDSAQRVLLCAPLDPATGEVGLFSRLHEFTGSGEPDGLAVSSDGDIWVAIWDGARIDRLSPEGALVDSVAVPTRRPTAIAFGDAELFVTTAQYGLSDEVLAAEPLAGRVLTSPVDVSGLPLGELALVGSGSGARVVA